MKHKTFQIAIPEDADSTMIDAVHIMDTLIDGLNQCQTREELYAYVGSEAKVPTSERRLKAIRAIKKAQRELKYPC